MVDGGWKEKRKGFRCYKPASVTYTPHRQFLAGFVLRFAGVHTGSWDEWSPAGSGSSTSSVLDAELFLVAKPLAPKEYFAVLLL